MLKTGTVLLLIAGLFGALFAGLVAPAEAGEVRLQNGDVLRGDVRKEGGVVVLEHPVLGELRLEKTKLTSYILGAAPATAAAVSSPAPCVAPAASKVTREPVPEETKKKKRPWDLAFTLGLSDENGNTDKFIYNLDLEGEYRWGLNTVDLRLRTSYEEASHIQTEGKFHGLASYARKVSPRGSVWGKWIADRDDFADLLLRSGWFVGYSHDIVQKEKTKFTASLGAGYVYEDRKDTPALETAAFLGVLDFSHEFCHGDTFRANYWIIPYVDETERSPMRLELRYAHPLRAHFDVTAGFIVDYVPDPPQPGIDPYDTTLLFGFRWRP